MTSAFWICKILITKLLTRFRSNFLVALQVLIRVCDCSLSNKQPNVRDMVDNFLLLLVCQISLSYTATSRKVVGKSVRDNSERYCGWFLFHCSSKKFERMSREAMDLCLRVLKEKNKSRFDSCCVSNSVFIISYACYLSGLSRAHFSDNLSRNSCMHRACVSF